MASNITIGIGADSTKLRAELAVSEAALRSYNRALSDAARAANKAGDELSMAKVGQAVGQFEAQKRQVEGLRSALGEVANSGNQARTALSNVSSASTQLSFQINDLVTQVSSGTSVFQALAQQGGQIIQIFQTNAQAAGWLGTAIGALASPLGAAAAAGAVLAGVFAKIAYDAGQAESAITKLHNTSLLQGRPAATVAANAQVMARQMMGAGGIGRTDAAAGAAGIQAIPGISGGARQLLSESFEALSRTQFEGDATKTGEVLSKAFGSPSGIKGFVEQNDLLKGALRDQFNEAERGKDVYRMSELAAQGLRDRLSGVIDVLKQAREQFGLINTIDIFGRPTAPDETAFEAEMRKRMRTPFGESLRFPEGSQAPTPDERRRDRLVEEYSDTTREKLEDLKRNRDFLQGRVNSGVLGAPELEKEKTALEGINEEIEKLQKQIDKVDKPAKPESMMNQLRLELERQRAGIKEGFAGQGSGTDFSSRLNNMINAAKAAGIDIGVTSGTRTPERQQQLWDAALQKYGSASAARKWVAPPGSSMHEKGMAADLRFGNGAREWAHSNASQFGLRFPMGHEPWHIEPSGGRSGGSGSSESARTAVLQFELKYWESKKDIVKNNADDLMRVEQEIAQARTRLAEDSMRRRDQSEKSAIQEAKAAEADAEKARKENLRGLEKSFDNISKAVKKFNEEMEAQEKFIQKWIDDWAAPFKSAFNSIEGSISSSISGLITGQTTWGKALQNVGNTAVGGLTDAAVNTLSKVAAQALDAAPGATLGDMAGQWIGKNIFNLSGSAAEVTNTAALTANTAATLANTAALGGAAVAGGASAAGSIVGGVGKVAGAAGTAVGVAAAPATGGLSLLGSLASIFSFSHGGIVPSAAGGWALPAFAGAKPALLHSEEMVLPKHLSKGIQGAIDGGGLGGGGTLNLHFNGPSDGPAVQRWFTGLMARNPGVVRGMLRSNALTPRTI